MKPYYETKLGKLYHGDCLEIMPQLEPVDLVLTDPPYGLDKKLSSGGGKHKNAKFRVSYENENWDKKISPGHFNAMFNISKHQIIFGANYYTMPPTRGILCWDKKQYMPTFSRWEYAWTNFDKPAKMFEVRNGSENRYHPTQKPTALFIQVISFYAKQGWTILDCFAGSGTTGVACERLGGFPYTLIEREEKYCEIIAKRLEQETSQLKLFTG